jgi:patatin-like phospholipase
MKIIGICVALLWIILPSCGSIRPTQPPKALTCNICDFNENDIYDNWSTYIKRLMSTGTLEGKKLSFNVLSLSAGGEFGAYGAGFLVGWSKVGDLAKPSPRKEIQVVTGVSTGAILATHAFLGLDPEIEAKYRDLSGEKIYHKRWTPEYLWANSIYETSAKDRMIDDNITSEIIDKVAEQYGKGRFLYIGIVNLDSGEFYRINMVKLAHDIQPRERRDLCYRAVIGASSAIPIAFSPKFIDGDMWVDGGVRRHMFITQPPEGAMGPDVTRRLYSFVHGDLSTGNETVGNGVLQIASRTMDLFIDQGMKDSIRLQEQLASECPKGSDCGPSKRLFETFYAAAASAAVTCKPKLDECTSNGSSTSDDMFCNAFMNCLANQGEKDGMEFADGTRKWLSIEDLCLGSSPDCTLGGKITRRLSQ